MDKAELRALIADIENLKDVRTHEVVRALNDRVLLAIGWGNQISAGFTPSKNGLWINSPGPRPSPLSNLQDATLVVPEGYDWSVSYSKQHGLEAHVQKPFRSGTCHSGYAPEGDETDEKAARALTLAALKAMEEET